MKQEVLLTQFNRIDKPLARLMRERACDISNETGDFTTDLADIKRILREDYEQLFTYKFDNSDEMDHFLKTYKVP